MSGATLQVAFYLTPEDFQREEEDFAEEVEARLDELRETAHNAYQDRRSE